jgi:hypothetical protein
MTVESKDGSAAVEACFEGCPCCQASLANSTNLARTS